MDVALDQGAPAIRAMRPTPVIHISTMGNLGNQMIQYAAAHALAARLGAARFSNVNLPPFGILHPVIAGDFPATEIVTVHTVELDRLAAALAAGTLQRVDIRTYAQRMENFLPPQAYAAVFRQRGPVPDTAGPDELLCNIRQGDILDGHHPDYVLIPPDFYADLAAETPACARCSWASWRIRPICAPSAPAFPRHAFCRASAPPPISHASVTPGTSCRRSAPSVGWPRGSRRPTASSSPFWAC